MRTLNKEGWHAKHMSPFIGEIHAQTDWQARIKYKRRLLRCLRFAKTCVFRQLTIYCIKPKNVNSLNGRGEGAVSYWPMGCRRVHGKNEFDVLYIYCQNCDKIKYTQFCLEFNSC